MSLFTQSPAFTVQPHSSKRDLIMFNFRVPEHFVFLMGLGIQVLQSVPGTRTASAFQGEVPCAPYHPPVSTCNTQS